MSHVRLQAEFASISTHDLGNKLIVDENIETFFQKLSRNRVVKAEKLLKNFPRLLISETVKEAFESILQALCHFSDPRAHTSTSTFTSKILVQYLKVNSSLYDTKLCLKNF